MSWRSPLRPLRNAVRALRRRATGQPEREGPAPERVGLGERTLRTLIDNLPDLIYVKDAGGRFVVANVAVALQDYAGAVVLVSHDRHLLRVVADEFLLVHAGHAAPFEGDLDDYATWLNASSGSSPAQSSGPAQPADGPDDSAEIRKQRRRDEAERRRTLSPLREAIAAHERELESLVAARSAIELELSRPEAHVGPDRARVSELLKEQARIARAIGQVETAWLEKSEQLETMTAAAAAARD